MSQQRLDMLLGRTGTLGTDRSFFVVANDDERLHARCRGAPEIEADSAFGATRLRSATVLRDEGARNVMRVPVNAWLAFSRCNDQVTAVCFERGRPVDREDRLAP